MIWFDWILCFLLLFVLLCGACWIFAVVFLLIVELVVDKLLGFYHVVFICLYFASVG